MRKKKVLVTADGGVVAKSINVTVVSKNYRFAGIVLVAFRFVISVLMRINGALPTALPGFVRIGAG